MIAPKAAGLSPVREALAKWLRRYKCTDELKPWEGLSNYVTGIWCKDADSVLALLSQHGVVQIVRRGDPTINTAQIHSVRPLVEEEK